MYDKQKKYRLMAELLYSLRLKSGLKQSELAAQMSVPQSFISKVENGERNLDFVELEEYCVAMGCPLNEFVSEYNRRLNES